MDVVLGLGNPGDHHRSTRHNVGFRVVERIAVRAGVAWHDDADAIALVGIGRVSNRDVVLAKPETFMNRSGHTAAALTARFGTVPERLVVVVDDADLVLGRVRIRRQGGSGGHRGLESIAASLGSDAFVRVRLGVGGPDRTRADLAEYVLSEFAPDESERVEDVIRGVADAVQEILSDGVVWAMNRWNGRVLSPIADGPNGETSTES